MQHFQGFKQHIVNPAQVGIKGFVFQTGVPPDISFNLGHQNIPAFGPLILCRTDTLITDISQEFFFQ